MEDVAKKFEDAKWIIRSHNPKKHRNISGQTNKNKQWSTNTTQKEENEDTKWVIRLRKCPKGKKDKRLSTKHHTENQRSRNTIATKNGGELRCSERVGSSCCTSGTSRVTLVKIGDK